MLGNYNKNIILTKDVKSYGKLDAWYIRYSLHYIHNSSF